MILRNEGPVRYAELRRSFREKEKVREGQDLDGPIGDRFVESQLYLPHLVSLTWRN